MVRFRFLYRQYINVYLNTAHAAHYVYFNILMRKSLIRFHLYTTFLLFKLLSPNVFPQSKMSIL